MFYKEGRFPNRPKESAPHRGGLESAPPWLEIPLSWQLLFERLHPLKQITHFLHAPQDFVRREDKQLGVLFLQAIRDLFPGHRRRDRRLLLGAQRIDVYRRLVFVVLAPIDKYFSFAQGARHFRNDELWMFV